MHEPQKSVLADAIWSKLLESSNIDIPTGEVQYLLDGGALLYCLPWPHGSPTYREVCPSYCSYETSMYGQPYVVFVGYGEPSTKYMTHQRRTGGKMGAEVSFTEEMKMAQKKNEFLSNVSNKQKFINLLAEYLRLSWLCGTSFA